MKKTFGIIVSIFVILGLVLAGCTAPDTWTKATNLASTGKIEIRVTDAPPDKTVTGIMVTVDSVSIHKGLEEAKTTETTTTETTTTENSTTEVTTTETTTTEAADDSGWMPLDVLEGKNTFDLLQIQGLEELLAVGDLQPGKYTQVRMYVSLVEVTFDDEETVAAKLPSGTIKLVRPFEIVAGETTVLLFDFDALKSVNVTGNSSVIFKPVIKLSVTEPIATTEPSETPEALEITTTELPEGTIGTEYTTTLEATGGTGPYTWSIPADNLPEGLTLDSATGIISGTPTVAGEVEIGVVVTDSADPAGTDAANYTLTITE